MRGRGEPPGAHTTWWRGLALGHAILWCDHPGQPLLAPPRVYRLPEKLRPKGGSEIDFAASAGRKRHTERKLSDRQKSARENPSRRGEIVAIIITIELGFIGIIIVITIIIRTFIIFITTLSRCNILG
jgi:hypothetical protein